MLVLKAKNSAPEIDPRWSAHAQVRALSPLPQRDDSSDEINRPRSHKARHSRAPSRRNSRPKIRRRETPLESSDDDDVPAAASPTFDREMSQEDDDVEDDSDSEWLR